MEEDFQVALLRNGFADFQERFKLTLRVLQARIGENTAGDFLRILHEFQNSIRFGQVTTERNRCVKLRDLRILCCAVIADGVYRNWRL